MLNDARIRPVRESMAAGGVRWRHTRPWRHAIRAASARSYLKMRIVAGCRRGPYSNVKELDRQSRVLSRRRSRPSFAVAGLSDYERAQGRPSTGWYPWSACNKKTGGPTPVAEISYERQNSFIGRTCEWRPSEPETAKAPLRNMSMRQGGIGGGRPADSDRLLLLRELPRGRKPLRATGFRAARAQSRRWNRLRPISKGPGAIC